MDAIDERFAVYTVVVLICSAIATVTGVGAAATLGIMAAGVEFAYWVGGVMDDLGPNGASS